MGKDREGSKDEEQEEKVVEVHLVKKGKEELVSFFLSDSLAYVRVGG